jgi:hypothetical protein
MSGINVKINWALGQLYNALCTMLYGAKALTVYLSLTLGLKAGAIKKHQIIFTAAFIG